MPLVAACASSAAYGIFTPLAVASAQLTQDTQDTRDRNAGLPTIGVMGPLTSYPSHGPGNPPLSGICKKINQISSYLCRVQLSLEGILLVSRCPLDSGCFLGIYTV